jgi:hypothetical protein
MLLVLKKFTFCILVVATVLAVFPNRANGRTALMQKTVDRVSHSLVLEPGNSNFLLGKEFVVARMSASTMNSDRAAFHAAAVDLMYLIESLGESNEKVELRAILSSVLNRTVDADGASSRIDEVLGRYSLRQPKDDRWYLEIGAATARMVYSAFYADAERLESDLAKIALLSNDSPKSIDSALLMALKDLCAKNRNGRITDEEFETLTEQGLAIFKKIEG